MDIFILKPIDLAKGNHKVILDFNNRGEMRLGALNDAPLSNSPTTAQAGNGFVMNLGYSVVGNGWDFGAASDDDGMTISVPVAKNADGSSITGPSCEYINFDDAKNVKYDLTYPAASMDKSKATLTLRARLDDPTTTVPERMGCVNEKTIRLLPAGTPFKQSYVYEFTYCQGSCRGRGRPGGDTRFHVVPPPRGEGHVRHSESACRACALHVRFSISQPTRALNDFLALGFNEDESTGACSTGCSNGRAVAAAIRLTTGSPKPAGLSGTDRTTCIPRAFFHLLISAETI